VKKSLEGAPLAKENLLCFCPKKRLISMGVADVRLLVEARGFMTIPKGQLVLGFMLLKL